MKEWIIEPPVYTNWGSWGEYRKCAPGHFVKGMQLKIEPYLGRAGGGDDTMLNAIRLTCTDEEVLVSAEGP